MNSLFKYHHISEVLMMYQVLYLLRRIKYNVLLSSFLSYRQIVLPSIFEWHFRVLFNDVYPWKN